jgi:hypothetical protein
MSWTIIYYYHNDPVNLESLYKFNSKNQIIPIHIKHDLSHKEAWRNPDRTIRKHLNINDILYENILLVEWDVYINKEVTDLNFDGALFKYVTIDQTNSWCWWKEIDKLPEKYKSCITGGALWSLVGIKRKYLEILLNSEYDYLYEMDIFSEIRTPTLMKYLGIPLAQFPKDWTEFLYCDIKQANSMIDHHIHKESDVVKFFHPVKNQIF